MVDQGITDMVDGFKTLGEFIHKIFESDYALYFIVLATLIIMFTYIFKMLLSKMPMFEGTGDQKVNSFGNVISWCLSLLAIISIGWQTKEAGVKGLINGFAGPWGAFIIIAISMFAGYGVYKNLENSSNRVRRWAATVVGGLIFFWMTGNIFGGWGWLWMFIIAVCGGLIVGFMISRGRRD
jgi:hypothetical protein